MESSKNRESKEEFRQYLIVVMGLTEASAKAYCYYVSHVEKIRQGVSVDAIVASDDEMRKTITLLRKHEPKKEAANFMSGLRAYYRFKNGKVFKEVPNDDVRKHSTVREDTRKEEVTGDIPFEIKQQLNDLEFKMYERQDAFWCQIFQLAVAVLLVIPTLMMGESLTSIAKAFFLGAMIMGSVGIACMFPLLRRPFRQTKEIYDHGKKIMEGEETRLEITPIPSTRRELLCQRLSVIMCVFALLLLIVTFGITIF